MGFIKEFQDFMNEAIEQLLKKPARKHACQKDKPELRMEQGKCKEVLRKEAEMFPPINVSGDSDDEQNSRISLETMDTDQCIQKLVRTDQKGSEHTQRKIEETVQYWAAQEKKAAMNYHRTDEHGVRYHISYVDIYEYIYLLYFPLYNSFIYISFIIL